MLESVFVVRRLKRANRFYSRVVLVITTTARGFVCEGAPAFMHEFGRESLSKVAKEDRQNERQVPAVAVLLAGRSVSRSSPVD